MRDRIAALTNMARALYPEQDFGYHVWPKHVTDVLEAGYRYGDRLRRYRLSYDRDVFQAAAVLHDAGACIACRDFLVRDRDGYRPANCSEEVAIALAVPMMERLGFASDFIAAVADAIDATRVLSQPTATTSVLLAAADLYNVGFGDYDRFLSDSRLLHREAQRLRGQIFPYQRFLRGSVSYLGLYAARELRLTPQYLTRERSAWHDGAMQNICRAVRGQLGGGSKIVVELGGTPRSIAATGDIPLLSDCDLHVTIAADYVARIRSMQSLKEQAQRLTVSPPMTVAIPLNGRSLSLPNNGVDQVLMTISNLHYYMLANFPAKELRRILVEKGELYLTETQVDSDRFSTYLTSETRRPVDEWLAPAGLRYVGEVERSFGTASLYRLE